MNILYLSHLSGASFAGPSYSVPKQIEAQSKLDNVFWYNGCISEKTEWNELPYYHDTTEYSTESILAFPAPFNNPDIIVVEGFYNMTRSNFRKELIKSGIPYVIIPRGELTKQAQDRKRFKKSIANLLFCNKFAHSATAIQYLTEREHIDSGDKWNSNYIVIPNGIDLPTKTKTSFSINEIKCISIGRIEPYQKGIDLLIEACAQIKDELEDAHCSIKIHGPDTEGKLLELKSLVFSKGLETIISFGGPLYGEAKEKALLQNDVFLMTSRFEGHPMALIEALSFGIPCLVTTGSNMSDEIIQNSAGWCSTSTVISLANTLKKMIKDYDAFSEKGKNACLLAENYSWELLSLRAHQKYQSIMNS